MGPATVTNRDLRFTRAVLCPELRRHGNGADDRPRTGCHLIGSQELVHMSFIRMVRCAGLEPAAFTLAT